MSKQSFVNYGQPHPVLLYAISVYNTIAPYITNLTLGHYGFDRCEDHQLEYIREITKDCASRLVSVRNKYTYIVTIQKAKLHQTLRSGCRDTVYTLLMVILPNLTCTAFPDGQGVSPLITRLIAAIWRAARSHQNTAHPLSRLSHVSLSRCVHYADPGYYDDSSLLPACRP